MDKSLTVVDLPKGLILNDLEQEILRSIVSGKRPKDIAERMGIPVASINRLISNEKVKEFMLEMIEARNLTLKMELPNLLMQMIDDKIEIANEEGIKLGETTKKDIPDLIRSLTELLKASEPKKDSEVEDGFAKIYNRINVIQKGE